MDELLFTVLAGAVVVVLGHTLANGNFSDDPMQYSLWRILNWKRRQAMPGWPQTEAQITGARRTRFTATGAYGRRVTPDKIDVTFEYHVDGVAYNNGFRVLPSPQDWYWQNWAVESAAKENVVVRYDPENPADSAPVAKTWHEFEIWSWG